MPSARTPSGGPAAGVIAAVLLGALALLVLPTAVPRVTGAATGDEGGTGAPAGTPVTADPAVEGEARADEPTAGARAVARPDPGDRGPRLTVVEKATGRPVAGAEVWSAERDDLRRMERDDGPRHWADRLMAARTPVRTDGLGQVPLPPVRERLRVAARAGDLFGITSVRPDTGNATVALEPDATVRVRVTDARGRVQPGIDVVLCVDAVHELDEQSRARTDERGIAVLRHVQLHRRRVPPMADGEETRMQSALGTVSAHRLAQQRRRDAGMEPDEDQRRQMIHAWREYRELRSSHRRAMRADRSVRNTWPWAPFAVAAEVPQAVPPVLRFPATAIPEGILELRLGPVGALEVHLIGPDGKPLWMPCRLDLEPDGLLSIPPSLEPTTFRSLLHIADVTRDKPAGAGPVRLAPLGAGMVFDLEVEFEDDDFDFRRRGIRGPAAGEVRTLELVVPGWFTVLGSRLVDGDGQPWRELTTELLVSGAGGRVEGEEITTDGEGRFELPIRLHEGDPPYTLEVRARQEERALGCLVGLPELERGRRHELGDVTVTGLPVLARGHVHDDRGEPVAGARVRLQTFRPSADGPGRWRDVAYVRDRTGDDGAFVLHGSRRAGRLRLEARARGHARRSSGEIAFGAGVGLVLPRLGRLVAEGTLPEGTPRRALQGRLERAGGSGRRVRVRPRADGTFRLQSGWVEPGTYELTIGLRGVPRPVLRLPGIAIPPGATERLGALDLRGGIHRYVVHAVDRDGGPVRDPGSPLLAFLPGEDGGMHWVGFRWRDGRTEFFAPDPRAEVVLLARGHRPHRTWIAHGETRLTVREVRPLEVHTPGLRGRVGAGRRVRLSLVHTGDTGLPMTDFRAVDQRRGRGRGYPRAALGKSGGAWLDDDDVVRMRLMLDGRYRVVARLYERGVRGPVSVDIGTVDVVLDGPEVQRVTVTAPPEVIAQALAELQERARQQ